MQRRTDDPSADDGTDLLWHHLHWLTVLADQGSFTAAARRLGVSKAGMSQRIAALERAAGVPLVSRTTRSVRLTEAGERLVDQTRGPFEAIARSFAGVRDLAGVPRGRVRVSAPVALARQQLVPRLGAFVRACPEVRLELDLSDRLVALTREGFDVAIRHSAAPPEADVAWPLCRTRTVLVASRGYLRRHGNPTGPEMLRDHHCLAYPRIGAASATPTWHFRPRPPVHRASRGAKRDGSPGGDQDGLVRNRGGDRDGDRDGDRGGDRDDNRDAGRDPNRDGKADPQRGAAVALPVTVAVTGPIAANNSEALRDAAIEGLGLALLPDFTAQAAVQAGRLVEVLPRWEAVGVFGEHLYAIRPYAPRIPRAVGAFVEWLRATFADGFALDAPPPARRAAGPAHVPSIRASDPREP